MDDNDIGAFDDFLKRNWGITPQKLSTADVVDDLEKVKVTAGASAVEEEAPKPKKRGRKPKAKPVEE